MLDCFCRSYNHYIHTIILHCNTIWPWLAPYSNYICTVAGTLSRAWLPNCQSHLGVFIRWTGKKMDHCTAGMDYWNGLLEHACHKFEVSMTIVHMHAHC